MSGWTVADSAELYGIPRWGADLFDASADGHLVVTPTGQPGPRVDVHELIQELMERGIRLPILLRFNDIVRTRIRRLVDVFNAAREAYDYRGQYRGVYPIKVNQQRHLVEEIVRAAGPHHVGLEAGSKPELLVTLALLDDPQALIICNGYKDQAYIQTALLAQKLGRRPVIVIEKLSELDTVIEVSRRLGIRPTLGVRSKLAKRGRGRWSSSSGDQAKFGLTARDIVLLARRLEAEEMLDCLRLLHFHIGSQVSAIRTFKEALREATVTYVELAALGAPMGILDVGGGLGVDYDGSQSNYDSSVNYTEQQYANDVVSSIASACDKAGIPHPDLVTEAGRAMVAHHSLLIFDVLGMERMPTVGRPIDVADDAPEALRDLREIYDNVTVRNYAELYADAVEAREQGLSAYNLGMLRLEERAELEHLFWQVCGRIRQIVRQQSYVPEELQGLERAMADTYYCNFSVFQSIPDAWAIKQLFPCLPIHRLNERPTRYAVLADLTCDSDGKVDQFIDLRDVKPVLELHAEDDQPYLLAFALVGAYQEILGDLHNLFGDTNAVHVGIGPDGEYTIDRVIEGDRVQDVLGYVLYERRDLVHAVRDAAERALRSGAMTREESRKLLDAYTEGLDGYTYFAADPAPATAATAEEAAAVERRAAGGAP